MCTLASFAFCDCSTWLITDGGFHLFYAHCYDSTRISQYLAITGLKVNWLQEIFFRMKVIGEYVKILEFKKCAVNKINVF